MKPKVDVIRCPREMQKRVDELRLLGKRIAVVPTMGFLHEGHLSLLKEARSLCDYLILTIFVNPTQFGPTEDLERYPRDEDGDLEKAAACGVDIAFCPNGEKIYGPNYQTLVKVDRLSLPLCGASRPEHFGGVTTIVTKLFNITKPHIAVFGQKDFQQLAILRQMNSDLDFGIEIVGMPIVREADGLAMSSRNAYLDQDERMWALGIHRGLFAANDALQAGETTVDALVAIARSTIPENERIKIDYLEIRDAKSLDSIERVSAPSVIAAAVFVGKTRLIDNVLLTPP